MRFPDRTKRSATKSERKAYWKGVGVGVICTFAAALTFYLGGYQ